MALTTIGEVPQWGGVADWSSCRTLYINASSLKTQNFQNKAFFAGTYLSINLCLFPATQQVLNIEHCKFMTLTVGGWIRVRMRSPRMGMRSSRVGMGPGEWGWDLADWVMRPGRVGDEASAEWGWDLAEWGWDLSEWGWDLSRMGMRPIRAGVRPSRVGMRPIRVGIRYSRVWDET